MQQVFISSLFTLLFKNLNKLYYFSMDNLKKKTGIDILFIFLESVEKMTPVLLRLDCQVHFHSIK